MKKILLAAAVIAASASAAVAEETYAPQAGDFSVEVQFNPFSNNFETFKIDQLQGRYFFSEKDAVRFGLGFGVSTDKETADPDNNSDLWEKKREGNFSINIGYERHFYSNRRVDLYAGAGIGFSLNSTCTTIQKEGLYDLSDPDSETILTQKTYNAGSWNQFVVKAFTGIDFYVYKGLYLGAELGLKVGFKSFPGVYTKGIYNDEGLWRENEETDKGTSTKNFELGLYAEPALRLGWTF